MIKDVNRDGFDMQNRLLTVSLYVIFMQVKLPLKQTYGYHGNVFNENGICAAIYGAWKHSGSRCLHFLH